MTDAQFNQQGDAIDYVPSVDTAAGAVVVQGDLIGVTKRPIKAGELGALALTGLYEMAKATGAGTDVTMGTILYWDEAAQQVTKTATGNKEFGKAVADASEDDTAVRVRLVK